MTSELATPSDTEPTRRSRHGKPGTLLGDLESLGLTSNQARLLLALFQVGSATSPELVEVSGVPRTSVYPIIEELSGKGLAHRVSGPGPAKWTSAGRDQVLDVLIEEEHDRLAEHEANLERVRRSLAEAFPDAPSPGSEHLQVMKSFAQVQRSYARILSQAQTRLDMFVRSPRTWSPIRPRPAVLGAVSRGVQVRLIYVAGEWEDESNEALRAAAGTCQEAGASVRLADELPVELVVADRYMALVAMKLESGPEESLPLTLWIENPGYATVHADAFDRHWATARPVG